MNKDTSNHPRNVFLEVPNIVAVLYAIQTVQITWQNIVIACNAAPVDWTIEETIDISRINGMKNMRRSANLKWID